MNTVRRYDEKNMVLKGFGAGILAVLCGCATAADHARSLHSADDRKVTVGIVQREIRNGMSGAEVAEALGSPNIVTKDSSESETWIYDKIATEASYSNSRGGVGGLAGVAGEPGAVLLLGLFTGR